MPHDHARSAKETPGHESTRRRFLQQTAAGITAVGLGLAASSYTKVRGANDRVRVAAVGIRGMGYSHVKAYSKLQNVEVAALCDVDENILASRLADCQKEGIGRPETYIDLRKLLEDRTIDAISVATPNHWHALAAFWAAQAGKHAAIEKPGTHNIFEGQQLIKAAKKYNVLIQHHAERRCFTGFQEAMKFLHSGGLGEVYMAKGVCYKWRNTIGKVDMPQPIPPGVHYDLWLGPAPYKPLMRKQLHYDWHWQWDYGNGDLGNQGAHQMDIARWGLGVQLPTRVVSLGGHFMFEDDQQTPNVQMAWFEFPATDAKGETKRKVLQFEVRHWISNHEGDLGEGPSNSIGNLFYGSQGYMTIDGGGNWKTYMGKQREPGPSGSGGGNMFANFIDAIRSGDRSLLEGDITEGHYSCALIHLANTSYRLGRPLDFDPRSETYINDREANAMLTRDYRAPYVVTREV
jgi:predicted dehydrogenase